MKRLTILSLPISKGSLFFINDKYKIPSYSRIAIVVKSLIHTEYFYFRYLSYK